MPGSPRRIIIEKSRRVRPSETRRFINGLWIKLAVARMRPDLPFRVEGDGKCIVADCDSSSSNLLDDGLAIYRTDECIVLCGLKRRKVGGWMSKSLPFSFGVSRLGANVSLTAAAIHIIRVISGLTAKQRRVHQNDI